MIPDSRKTHPIAYSLSFAFLFGIYIAFLKCAIHFFASPFYQDANYRLGALLGIGADVLLGMLIVSPVLFLKNDKMARGMGLALAVVFFAIAAGGGHYHAVFNRLPHIDTVFNMRSPGGVASSIASHVPLWLLFVELLVPTICLYVTAVILAPKWQVIVEDPRKRWLAVLGVVLGAIISIGTILNASGQILFGTVNPLAYLAMSSQEVALLGGPQKQKRNISSRPPERLIRYVQGTQGYSVPTSIVDPAYPYCADKSITPKEDGLSRSAILIILEGVGMNEMSLRVEDKIVMPNLNRIGRDGVLFRHFFASGDRSSQALVSIMSGISSPTHLRPLMHAPLVNLEGFPEQLAQVGYDTFYFHGSDLSFEQQRTYLKKVGFAEIVEPKPEDEKGRLGWGMPDGEMFNQLKRRIIDQRENASSEYLGALFTLSSHDPYAVPKEYENRIPGTDSHSRFANSLSYLDEQLGRFYDWYVKAEKPKGTILMVTSDHIPLLPEKDARQTTHTGEFEYRFHIPLIVIGSSLESTNDKSQVDFRVGGHLDIAPSLVGQMGWNLSGCYQGVDLFAPPERWPGHRYVVSLAGEQLEFVYVSNEEHRWMANLKQKNILLHNWKKDTLLTSNLLQADSSGAGGMVQFIDGYLQLGYYLNKKNHYAPERESKKRQSINISASQKPLLVSHRGNVDIETAKRKIKENSLDAIENAVSMGAKWVEIDVQLTGDNIPFVFHDSAIETQRLGRLVINSYKLADLRSLPEGADLPTLKEVLERFASKIRFCVELKPQENALANAELARQVIVLLSGYPNSVKRFIVDSFSRTILSTIVAMSDLSVGYDLPQNPVKEEWLEYAADARFSWIYVHENFANAQLVEKAHGVGLKVMVYTVNQVSNMKKFEGGMPDGIITDRMVIWPKEYLRTTE
jgi:glycerophosphoryl diester phosphodiesterase/arylsulfatase A-like enzyme